MVALVAWPRPAVTPVPADTTVMSVVAVAAPASVPHLPQSTVPTCAPRSKVTGRGSLAVLARPVAAVAECRLWSLPRLLLRLLCARSRAGCR